MRDESDTVDGRLSTTPAREPFASVPLLHGNVGLRVPASASSVQSWCTVLTVLHDDTVRNAAPSTSGP
jgi:hypothetical protein